MGVYKDNKTNTWRVIYRYTDWTGEQKQSSRRGFASKHEAQAWEREQLNKVTADLDMSFASFVEHYTEDLKTRLKENTWNTKDHIIRTKLIPYFGKLKMCAITPQIVMTWQNEMLRSRENNGKPYSPVYLRTVQNQLTAIFNHAMKYYKLRENPCRKAGPLGKKKSREMLFWTKEEYLKFADAMMDKPKSFYAFELLYWCGMREGELLALTPADFDLEKGTVTINKSYQRIHGEDMITTPKTEKSNRTITMPDFLTEEVEEYVYFFCPTGKKCGCVSPAMVKESDLLGCVTESLKAHIENVISLDGLLSTISQERLNHELIQEYSGQIANCETQLTRIASYKGRLYENLVNGCLTKEEYLGLKKQYSDEYDALQAAIMGWQGKITEVKENRSERSRWINQFRQFEGMEGIDRRAVIQLIRSIRIVSKNEIEITFNYADEYEKAVAISAQLTERREV